MSLDEFASEKADLVNRLARGPDALAAPPALIELLPIAIYACAADGRILWYNRRAAALWGREPRVGDDSDKYCGSYKLFFSGRQIGHDETPMAHVLRTGEAIHGVEGKVERPDGTTIWAMVHIDPIRDEHGNIAGAINCFHETTALHHAPDEIEDFFENSELPMHIVSRNGAILRANKAELSMLGYAADEYIGHSILDFHADRPVIDDILRRLLKGEAINRYRARLRAKDGSIKHVEVTSNARTQNGEFVNTRCVTLDISEKASTEELLARRVEEQTALFDFTEKLQRASSTEDIYDSALEAITRALHCERASVLIFDERSVMRFVAWRGLSETYRRAVEGHSPWQRDAKDPQPLCLEDVDHADLGEELTRTVKAEGIQAVAFIPLIESGRLLGKFMVYYDAPHRFTDAEVDIALTIARQIGFSLERKYAEAELRDSKRQLQELLAAIPAAIYTTDAQGTITYFNEAAVEFAGRRPVIGSDKWCVTWKLYWPDGTPLPHDQCPMAVALREGRAIRNVEAVAERPDGTRVPFIPYPTALRDSEGNVVGAINMLVDISERRQAETHARMLLNELNHRVKNNMQMIQSLLDGAARRVRSPEAQRVFEEASRRMAAMAAAQRVLYATPRATQFKAADFVAAVCNTTQEILPNNVKIVCEQASGDLSNDVAMPLALILNELLTNAAKHGGGQIIRAGLIEQDGAFELYVEDAGPGFDLATARVHASGLRLVEGLARQLRGTFEVRRNPSRCCVKF